MRPTVAPMMAVMRIRLNRRQWLAAVAPAMAVRSAQASTAAVAVLHDGGSALSVLDGVTLQTQRRLALPLPMSTWLAPGLLGDDRGQMLMLQPAYDGVRAQARFGSARCRAARSADGRWLLLLPAEGDRLLLLLDAGLQVLKTWPLPGPPVWMADAPHRRALVVALASPPQLWLISYDERAEDFYEGLVHDFRMGEGVPQKAFHNPRRVALPAPLRDASADVEDTEWAGQGMVVNLDVRKVVARPGALQPPAPGAAALTADGSRMVVPVRGSQTVAVFGTADWRHLGTIETARAVVRVRAAAGRLWLLPSAHDEVRSIEALDGRSLQRLPPLPLPGPLCDAVPATDGQALWLWLGGEAEGIARVDAQADRPGTWRPLKEVAGLQGVAGRAPTT